ncbi:BREX system ATP-binding protein BrxD [Polyangium spumosum]|nr:BREX system ATP-binding protein BrxD [Polyangium spumosum]
MTVSEIEAREIVAALRAGAVPERGLHHIATGLDKLMDAVDAELDFVSSGAGRGLSKWIRGEYGSGKTFATRLLCARARARRFATSEVQISINDTPLQHLETVYRRLMERLTTAAEGSPAFPSIVDAWLFDVGEQVTALRGLSDDDPAFITAVEERLEDKLAALRAYNPAFTQVLRAYHRAMSANDFGTAQQLLAWLSGQPNVDRTVTSRAGVKGNVDGQAALAFLRGVLMLLRQSGYAGLVVVLDEVETVQRMSAPAREKSLNALRQLVDMLANNDLPGLYLVVTGTPEFFDGYKGLKSLPPLYQRIAPRFEEDPRHDNLRALQVRLLPFDTQRLLLVGQRVRGLFPAQEGARVQTVADDAFLEAMVREVTSGFGGQVAVCPRIFLKEVVDVLDKVDQHSDYDPRGRYKLEVNEAELRPEELAARRGIAPSAQLDLEEQTTEAKPAEEKPSETKPARTRKRSTRRLDG